jgi:hypothetical protein
MASVPNSYGWQNADVAMCIRCDEAPIVDENGYCGHCHWVVRAEIEEGFSRLRERLRKEVSFQEWLARHPEAA